MKEQNSESMNTYVKILGLLKENTIAKETENESYARVCRKTEIEPEQVKRIVAEMGHTGLVTRRTTPPIFKLTEFGEEYLGNPLEGQKRIKEKCNALAEALGTLAISRLKQRGGTEAMQEFVAAEEKWEKTSIPDKQDIREIRKTAGYLRTEVSKLCYGQPKCWLVKAKYDREFEAYKAHVENTKEQNKKALKLINDFSLIEEHLQRLQNDIKILRKWRETKWRLMDNEQKSHSLNVMSRLEEVKRHLEQFGKDELIRLKQLKGEFEKNDSTLEKLVKPTHEWVSIERQIVITKPGRIARAESSIESTPAEQTSFVVKRKCRRCLKEE